MHATAESETPSRFADWYRSHELGTQSSKRFLSGAESLDYRELFLRVRRLGTLFDRCGVKPGERILVASQSDTAVTVLFIAALRYGVTAVVIDPHVPPRELRRLADFVEGSLHFVDSRLIEAASFEDVSRGDARWIPIYGELSSSATSPLRWLKRLQRSNVGATTYPALLLDLEPDVSDPSPPDPETTAYILFTSGTTSQPKGVEISHRGLDTQMRVFLEEYGLHDEVRLLNLLPLHHADGITQGPVLAFVAGGTIVRPFRFEIQRIGELLDSIYADRITHFVAVPSMLALIVEFGRGYTDAFAGGDFKFVISTAAHLTEKVWRSFEGSFGTTVVNVYGLTETVNEALYCGPDPSTRKVGTIGKPVGCEARIVDDLGNHVGPDTPGELLLRGDLVMKGYFRQPEATAKMIRDGWLHTGDLATVDGEGFYRIVGRKKNVIIVGGINVYPEEIADVLMRIPDIREAVVLGVPDEVFGEIPVACIVPMPGRHISEADVLTRFLEHASREHAPRRIHIVDELPRGPAGKVVLSELREIVAPKAMREMRQDDLALTVIDIAADVFGMKSDALSPETGAGSTAQWDSLAHVNLLFALEKQFDLRFSPQEILSVQSLGDAISVIRRKKGELG